MADAAPAAEAPARGFDRARGTLAGWLPPHRETVTADVMDQRADNVDDKNNDVSNDPTALLSALNEEMNRRLDKQWDTITQLDTKAGLLITFEVTAAGLLIAQPHTGGIYAALGCFAVALMLTLTCVAVRSWSNAPRPDVLVELEQADPALAYDRLIRAKAKAELHNAAGLIRKADWLKIATWWLLIPVVATAASFLF